jgi:putative methionine-R-sulfoxide reductase with GAF domain
VLADISHALASNQPSFHRSPLELVAELLSDGRHYSWVGIYLSFDKNSSSALLEKTGHPGHVATPGARKKILVSIKIAGRELGFLSVESDRENAVGVEDRVLLERVSGLLARFLSGKGRYLVRRAVKPSPVPRAAAA